MHRKPEIQRANMVGKSKKKEKNGGNKEKKGTIKNVRKSRENYTKFT